MFPSALSQYTVLAAIFTCLFVFFNKIAAEESSKKQSAKEIVVENMRFSVFDRDSSQPTGLDSHSINFGQKISTKLAIDSQKKLQLTFLIKDKANAGGVPLTVHQAFILLVHAQSGREIIYVAEPERNSKIYTFDLDMKAHTKDFAGVGGNYEAHLLLGDFQVANPLNWDFASLELSIPSESAEPTLPKSKQINYKVLPQIEHQFREPEQRPPVILSDAFAVICAAPFLVLLVLWFRIGINFGNFKFSLWALGFHIGLGAIFGLYACYWLKLNMFQTLNYLAIIAVPTLVCGNRLLHSFSTAKKHKSE